MDIFEDNFIDVGVSSADERWASSKIECILLTYMPNLKDSQAEDWVASRRARERKRAEIDDEG